MLSKRKASVALVLTIGILTGCSAPAPDVDEQRSAFLGGDAAPIPEGTISPQPNTWSDIAVPDDYRVIAIRAVDDPASETVATAVEGWAAEHGVAVETRSATDADDVETQIVAAASESPDLIVGAGAGIVDVFSLLTSQFLDRQFLIVGATLAEPTANVTAAVWPGAGFRGTGITPEADDDPAAVTPERAREAVEAGYASIHLGVTGVVVSLP